MTDMIIDITEDKLRTLVQNAWHDSATATADRVVEALKRHEDGDDATDAPPYVVGEWGHIFYFAGRQTERTCRIVYDVAKAEVTHMDVFRNHKWRESSRSEREDVTDSLRNANPEALEKPGDWGLAFTSELPAWTAEG